MVTELQNSKDANYSYIQFKDGDFVSMGSSKEDHIQMLLHKDKVWNYIEALNVIEESDECVEHVKAKIFHSVQYQEGIEEFP